MLIEPSGVIFKDICEIQTDKCIARQPAALSAVWTTPGRRQVNVCAACLEEQVRLGIWEIQGARIRSRADIAVYSPERKLQLVVEVKSRVFPSATAREQAVRVHRNLLAHSGIPASPYFLVVFAPGHFFLWKNSHETEPSYAINDESLLEPYLTPALSTQQLEVAVARWLEDVSHAKQPLAGWLVESGLYDALKNSSISTQAAMAA
jgi:hypothetical protein